jgi:carbonic anhydrase
VKPFQTSLLSLSIFLAIAGGPVSAAGEPARSADGDDDAHGLPAARADGAGGEEQAAPDLRIVVKGALQRLEEGNRRYAGAKASGPRRGKEQRLRVSMAQLPFAVVVGCADSRVPPEILFDQGLGDLFVVRAAGHVVDAAALGSIEYAVEHLGSRLVVVLGHERCGAVDAACKGGHAGGHVAALVEAIAPAVDVAKRRRAARGEKGGRGAGLLEDAVRANVELTVDRLKGAWPVLGPEIRAGRLSVAGAIYDLETGLVEFLP